MTSGSEGDPYTADAQLGDNGGKDEMDLDFFSASLTTEEMCELSLNEGSGVHESTSELEL